MNLMLEALLNGFVPEEDEYPEGGFDPDRPDEDD